MPTSTGWRSFGKAIRPDRDLAVVGMPDRQTGRVIGACKGQDIFKLMPFMEKV